MDPQIKTYFIASVLHDVAFYLVLGLLGLAALLYRRRLKRASAVETGRSEPADNCVDRVSNPELIMFNCSVRSALGMHEEPDAEVVKRVSMLAALQKNLRGALEQEVDPDEATVGSLRKLVLFLLDMRYLLRMPESTIEEVLSEMRRRVGSSGG